MYVEYFLAIKKHLIILITIYLLNIQISVQIIHPCKENYVLNNKTCYNDVIIFDHDRFRAGHASTNKNGDTIFEFSVDSNPGGKRLFYGLKTNGRYYFPGEPVYKEITLTDKNDTSNTANLGRFESYNLFVYTQEDTGKTKQYLFSISTFESLVELHDIENAEYQTIQTKKFINDKRIFSYQYSLFEIENTNTFILAAVLSCGYKDNDLNKEYSDINVVKKFQINSFSSTNMYKELASTSNTNDNFRAISAFRIDPKGIIALMFVVVDNNEHKLRINFYDDNLNYLNKNKDICTLLNVKDGFGHFVRAFPLKGLYAVFAYFTDYHTLTTFKFRIVEYNNNYDFTDKLTKDFSSYKNLEGNQYNGLFKLDEERVVYTTVSDTGRYLFFFIFDLYNNYSGMKIRRYKMKFFDPDLYFNKEFSVSYYNGYITLAAVLVNNNVDFPETSDSMSAMLMIFGFGNGTDFEIDISPYLMDTGYYNQNNNLFNRLMQNLTIDNNIFGYEKVYQIIIKLNWFPFALN